jgi:uncharacterized protein (TIGR02246 family)
MTTDITTDLTTIAGTVCAGLERAWNQADGATFGEAFTADTDFVDVRGDHHTGRTAVADGHQALFDHLYLGSVIRYRVEAVRTVHDGCALAIVAAILDVPRGPMQGIHHARATAVLVEHEGRWLIRAFHNTLVQERR